MQARMLQIRCECRYDLNEEEKKGSQTKRR